jgi:diacylglycerol kinase (ATP)
MTQDKQLLPKTQKDQQEQRSLAWNVAPDLFASFRYAWQGLVYATRTQRNFRIHLGVAIIVWTICFLLSLSFLETAVLTRITQYRPGVRG